MDDYIFFLIALSIVFCSLVAVMFIFLHCRKIERMCNRTVAKRIHDQDCVVRELERTRTEKAMMEQVLKTQLAEAVRTSLAENSPEKDTETPVADGRKHALQIDITYFV